LILKANGSESFRRHSPLSYTFKTAGIRLKNVPTAIHYGKKGLKSFQMPFSTEFHQKTGFFTLKVAKAENSRNKTINQMEVSNE